MSDLTEYEKVVVLLEQFSNITEQYTDLQARRDAMKAEAIPAEVKERLEAIDAELNPIIEKMGERLSLLKAEITAQVLTVGKTVRASRHMAVWAKGKEGSWDSKKLAGFAMAHPEIQQAKNPDGEPTVSFRVVGK